MFSDVTAVISLVRSDINFVGYAHVGFYLFKEVELFHLLHGNSPVRVKFLVVNRNKP